MYRATMLFLALTFSPALAAAQQPCTGDARAVVNELYRHMLERNADARSNYWMQQLNSGRTVRDVVRELAKSDEHVERFWKQESGEEAPYIRAVGTLYRHILGRQPDAASARTFANQATRRGVDPVIDQIVDSADYDQRFGDWGVPGSGGLQYCGPNNQAVNGNQGAAATRAGRGRQGNQDNQGNQGNQGNQAARRAQRFENLDINDNGRIDSREWDGTVAAFNRLDVNNDNYLTRAEMVGAGAEEQAPVGTTGPAVPAGQLSGMIRVEGRNRWTDTGINVREGQTMLFDARGTVRLAANDDVGGVDGALSGRRESNAPVANQPYGGLIARVGNSAPFYVGDTNSLRAPASGRLYLGVNDDYLQDNAGDFQVVVEVP